MQQIPFFCAVLEGSFGLAVPNISPIIAHSGDFILVRLARCFETFSMDRKPGDKHQSVPIDRGDGVFRLGRQKGKAEMRKLIGFGAFALENADLLAGLLPPLVHIQGDERLTTLVGLIDDKARTTRCARTGVMIRLPDVLMIEALRSKQAAAVTPGLLRGLSDKRVGAALRALHMNPDRPWTVMALAEEANLSRSAFFEPFRKAVGQAPMEYLLQWRMHLARQMLSQMPSAQVAACVGSGSTSAFSSAFTRYMGISLSNWLREHMGITAQARHLEP